MRQFLADEKHLSREAQGSSISRHWCLGILGGSSCGRNASSFRILSFHPLRKEGKNREERRQRDVATQVARKFSPSLFNPFNILLIAFLLLHFLLLHLVVDFSFFHSIFFSSFVSSLLYWFSSFYSFHFMLQNENFHFRFLLPTLLFQTLHFDSLCVTYTHSTRGSFWKSCVTTVAGICFNQKCHTIFSFSHTQHALTLFPGSQSDVCVFVDGKHWTESERKVHGVTRQQPAYECPPKG